MQRSTERQRSRRTIATRSTRARLKPLAQVIAMLAAGGVAAQVHAQQAFSRAWFADKGAVQSAAAATGRLPNGQPVSPGQNPLLQQQQAKEQLQHSFNNLNLAARAIASQQAAQAAARAAALASGSSAPDGLAEGGLKVDTNSLTAGWLNAKAPTQSVGNGKTTVTVEQTADKAILNWETFNVGKNTRLRFDQDASWSVLNRVNDPLGRPSRIQGQIDAPGTVLIVNRNGIVFEGSSQVNVRNLAAAAVGMSDAQFKQGLYGEAQGNAYVPTFANDLDKSSSSFSHGDAAGDVVVEQGARIATHKPASVTEGGGYVLLLGREASNAGQIVTDSGQTVLAAGDAFVIRKGMGTDSNQTSSTRGNEVTALGNSGSAAGRVSNTGLIQAPTGDITLTGRQLRQQGVAVATTSVNTRGTVHLNGLSNAADSVLLGKDSLTAVLLDESAATALDAQRDTLIKDSDKSGDRRDQSLIHITSNGGVAFAGDSLTLATGGQVLVDAAGRSELADGAQIDVSGAFGVRVAMESNNVLINVQGNEQRDAPVNRDGDSLRNNDIWVDRRDLVLVPAGTNGYATDRWYTAGGLLEVSGYLGTTGHSVGEWMALGGTVQFGGGELVTQAGSIINLSGGTLDVLTGKIRQTWLKGADGKLYVASKAPGDLLYTGLYQGFETEHARWGGSAVESFYNPLIAPREKLENGYTVGRDAGRLIVATEGAVLRGQIDSSVYQGPQQTRGRDAGLDGYEQAQTAVARRGELIIGSYTPVYDKDGGSLRYSPGAVVESVTIGELAAGTLPQAGHITLDAGWLNRQELGSLQAYAQGGVTLEQALVLAPGGEIALHAPDVKINADITARGGGIRLGDMVAQYTSSAGGSWVDMPISGFPPGGYTRQVLIGDGVTLDARGLWNNQLLDGDLIAGLPFVNGGTVRLRSSGSVVLGKDSLIDVSSGATLADDDSLKGGRGGSVTLAAGLYAGAGVLSLDGALRGYGVQGGGQLTIENGTMISIGGSLPQVIEQLPAGEISNLPLRLANDYVVQPGATIPLSFSITTSNVGPDQAVPTRTRPTVSAANPVTVQADWLTPTTVQSGSGQVYYAGTTVPAGTVLTTITELDAGYVLPANVFPRGLPIPTFTQSYTAGQVATTAVVVPAGSRIPAGTAWPETVAVQSFLELGPDLFQSGFKQYAITGRDGVAVVDGVDIAVTMPVLRFDRETGRTVATGEDPAGALSIWLPPLQQDNIAKGQTKLRDGASLSLTAGSPYAEGDLLIGEGSRISVDPRQSITLTGNAQITVEGHLQARGGRISVLPGDFGTGGDTNKPQGQPNGRSIWIGDNALLDVSGEAYTGVDAQDRRFGLVTDGGVIEIGAKHNLESHNIDAVNNFVVVRSGALLNASGAQAVLDLPGLGETLLGSDGGVIALSSGNGLYIDGLLRAGGGAGASGGTLALNLETPVYLGVGRFDYLSADVNDAVRVPRELVLEQNYGGSGLSAAAKAGENETSLVYGKARYGVDAIHTGGFDTASLYVNGLLSFDGDVDLHLNQALYLTVSGMGLSTSAPRDSRVNLAAPYLRVSGSTRRQIDGSIMPNPVFGSRNTSAGAGMLGVPQVADAASLTLKGNLIDLLGEFGLGAAGDIVHNSGTPLQVERDAFGAVRLESQGDLRLRDAKFFSPGDTVLAAAQIYGSGTVTVGQVSTADSPSISLDPNRKLDIERVGTGALPAMPYSVFGAMTFAAATVNQGGVLRAPLGSITLGKADGNGTTNVVNLLPGSITSVSAAGLVMPYGGTADGLVYNYNGADVEYVGAGNEPRIEFLSQAVNAQAGAIIDLSGGGELKGAAFLPGRGGSTDARRYPLVQMDASGRGFTLPGLSTNPVYAIVPGVQAGYAPVGAENGAGDPAIGRQITIGAGVPGLPAGTYTLLPSIYALLPGAFRVELNGLAQSAAPFGSATAMRNGSWSSSAQLGIANTGPRDTLPTQVILTSADRLRTYSQYNETSYTRFALDQAAREGVPRPLLERDAKAISLRLRVPPSGALDVPALRFDATVLGDPATGGYGSSASLWDTGNIEILADGASSTAGFNGVSVHARDLNAIGASRLLIGGTFQNTYADRTTGSLQSANVIGIGANGTNSIVLREGAALRAADVFLISGRVSGGITVEQGAGINTLGQGASSFDASQGYIYSPGRSSLLAVSNGVLNLLAPSAADTDGNGAGAIEIGVCAAGATCSGETRLYSEGTIATATDNRFQLGDTVRYGTRNLVLAVGAINVGGAQALADAQARGALPPGMTLNQDVLSRLLLGDTRTGAPALENLLLTARESINFYDSVELSTFDPVTGKSALQRLVLGTPAIYGYGDTNDVARIHTDTLVWSGAITPPGSAVANGPGTGSGKLVVDARQIEFGYGPKTQPDTVRGQDRLALGFSSVNLNASERVTANHQGSLSVYQSQGAWDETAKAFSYSGGDLNISTPLLTGQAGSVNTIKAGGDIHVVGTAAAGAPDNTTLAGALGAELALDSRGSLVLDTAVLLPSGKLSLSADGDVILADGALLDLAGRKIDFFDVGKYSWGGDVSLESRAGKVSQSAQSRIDLSATYNRAGKLTAIARQGAVDLAGQFLGSSGGRYDAGGTEVPFASGYIDVRGQTIVDFLGLNTRLSNGGVFGGRSFQLGQGDLVIGNEVKAHEVNVSVDNGRLTVNGTIDASGEQAGGIRLAGKNGVTLGTGAVLDTRASVLRKDSYGQVIEAPNRALIEVDSGNGPLVIGGGARFDLRVAGANANYGTVSLYAPRLGGNDVAIDAAGPVLIDGAKAITVNAFISDNSAAPGTETTTDGKTYQSIDQDYLDRLHGDSLAFINAALANGALMNGKLAGLRVYGEQFHLRPGVEIVANSAINPDGNLHVDGDIDLSGHRYASINPNTQKTSIRGSGEAGALVIRASGDLEIFGSVSDGFDGSRLTMAIVDNQGWVLTAGRQPHGGDVVVPQGGLVTLAAGTTFRSGKVLNYDLPIQAMQMAAGTLLPATGTLSLPLTLARGTVLGAAVFDAAGNPLYAAGTVLADATTLPAGTRLAAGLRLPVAASIAAMTWPAGVALPAPPVGSGVILTTSLALAKGAFIPSETDVKLPGGVDTIDLRSRDADGNQGKIWALAPMLPSGSQSWDITLVGGADTAAADRLTVARDAKGSLRLSDNHFGMGVQEIPIPGTGTPAVYRWDDNISADFVELLSMFGFSYEVVPGAEVTQAEVDELLMFGFIGENLTELNDWGYGPVAAVLSPGTPPDKEIKIRPVREQLLSVVRTGTGDLRLVSAGDILTTSLYGIYTAGTPSASLVPAGGADPYNQARSLGTDNTVLGSLGSAFEQLVNGGGQSLYQAWYPEAGGNLLLRAGGNIMGDSVGKATSVIRQDAVGYRTSPLTGSASLGEWLWRQGTGSVQTGADAVPTAWWINFGSYVPSANSFTGYSAFTPMPRLVGFTGFGTLGGGNLVLEAGGNAGMLQARGDDGYVIPRSQGLNLAVASTGRVTPSGDIVLTGGGDLDIRLGGGFNPDPATRVFGANNLAPVAGTIPANNTHRLDLNGTLTNLRGALRLEAGSVGGIELRYGSQDPKESRPYDIYTATAATAAGGPVLMLGDAGARIEARGDLVLADVGDAGRAPQLHGGTPFYADGTQFAGGGWSWFSLWTPSTAVDLLAAGGNLTPTLAALDGGFKSNHLATDGNHVYPSIFRAAAASGSLYYGGGTKTTGVVLAPSPVDDHFAVAGVGQLELLAIDSIYAGGKGFSMSGADPTRLPNPFNPGFVGEGESTWYGRRMIHNVSLEAVAPSVLFGAGNDGAGATDQAYPLFSFTPPTASGYTFVGQQPARYYAVEGDLIGLRLGSIVYRGISTGQPGAYSTWYDGGGPVAIRAGRDIVNAGTTLGSYDLMGSSQGFLWGAMGWSSTENRADLAAPRKPIAIEQGTTRGNLIVHTSADDVSVVEAGRDIRYSTFYIAGPGLLDISAGRDVYMADKAELRSLGPVANVTPGDRSSGAGIAVSAGVGAHGADWAAFAARYLDPANQADPELPFADQPGKALTIYSDGLTLAQWLNRQFGYSGDETGAQAFMSAKQVELDGARQVALASGGSAANRNLAREFEVESQLHLVNWLSARFGVANRLGLRFDAATMDARAFFAVLPPEQQHAFLRNVYYAELKASGREYNEVNGKRAGSYLRGREAIATLLPTQDAAGNSISYSGDLTMFSSALYYSQYVDGTVTRRPQPGKTYVREDEWVAMGQPGYNVPFYKVLDAGIHTDFGGDISLLAPGGRTLVGVDGGFTPGEGSGVLTQGAGDINIYSLGSILLGQSRIFTTFGGNILAWSAEGDINAGRGSKTTIVYTPQRRVYDAMGNVSLSPTTPNTGAGIATLNPIPEVPPGDIDLIAPLGTIDAGEAGIRVSGNVNLAALHVVNAENIQVQGEATGIPVVAAVNVGALTNASAAASSAANAASDMAQRNRANGRQDQPSIFNVRVLGVGDDNRRVPDDRGAQIHRDAYDRNGVVQVLGAGTLSAAEQQPLTPDERRDLKL